MLAKVFQCFFKLPLHAPDAYVVHNIRKEVAAGHPFDLFCHLNCFSKRYEPVYLNDSNELQKHLH